MKTERENLDGLFLVKGQTIVKALRRAGIDAVVGHFVANNFIATWENDRVVIVPAEQIPLADLIESKPALKSTGGPEKIIKGVQKMYTDRIFEHARRIYIEGGELCIEYSSHNKSMRDSLTSPDRAERVRQLCREITGRDMPVRIIEIEEAAKVSPLIKLYETRLSKSSLEVFRKPLPPVARVANDDIGALKNE